MKYNYIIKISISIFIAIGLLYFSFKNINSRDVIDNFSNTKIYYLFFALITYLSSLFIRSLIWKILLKKTINFELSKIYKSIIIGQMGNNLIPFRGGELLRIYYLKIISGLELSKSLSIIIIERMLDFFSLLLISIIFFNFIEIPNVFKNSILATLILLFSGLFIIIIISKFHKTKFIISKINILPRKISSKINKFFDDISTIFLTLNNFSSLILITVISILCWSLIIISIYFTLLSLDYKIIWLMPLSVVVYLNLGLLLPTIPAGIGIYQFFSMQALNHFDINSSSALSFSFILQFLDIVPTFILAMYFMYFDKTIFQKIFK